MSTEKLSKPVAWTSARSLDVRRKVTAFTDVESAAEYASANCWEKIAPLYSQEYVSALLADLEAKDKRIAELEAIQADASQVFKEIGNELGCNPDNESIMMAIDALKERLATPVRFPDCDMEAVSIMAHWLSDEEVNAWVKGVEFAKQQVRAAGFKVEGEA